MSPEQAQGRPLDCRTDVFAIGVVLWELLTGTRLFKRTSDVATLNAVAECRVEPPSRVNRRLPPDLDALVMRALAKDRADRYQEAVQLQVAIEEWLLSHQRGRELGAPRRVHAGPLRRAPRRGVAPLGVGGGALRAEPVAAEPARGGGAKAAADLTLGEEPLGARGDGGAASEPGPLRRHAEPARAGRSPARRGSCAAARPRRWAGRRSSRWSRSWISPPDRWTRRSSARPRAPRSPSSASPRRRAWRAPRARARSPAPRTRRRQRAWRAGRGPRPDGWPSNPRR